MYNIYICMQRLGAKKMVDNWDVCSQASIDGQWKHLTRDGVFSWKKVYINYHIQINTLYVCMYVCIYVNNMLSIIAIVMLLHLLVLLLLVSLLLLLLL